MAKQYEWRVLFTVQPVGDCGLDGVVLTKCQRVFTVESETVLNMGEIIQRILEELEKE